MEIDFDVDHDSEQMCDAIGISREELEAIARKVQDISDNAKCKSEFIVGLTKAAESIQEITAMFAVVASERGPTMPPELMAMLSGSPPSLGGCEGCDDEPEGDDVCKP